MSPNSCAGVGTVFPNVEVRHLHAVIALGEELNFTKAALRLNLTQSALSRQITEIEKQLRFRLFTRDNRRVVRVELTDAGRVFVEEARSSISHMERAFHLSRAAHDGADNVLTIGHSHEADQAWVSDPSCGSSPPVSQARHSTDQSVLNRVGPECSSRRTESGPGDGTAGGLSDRGLTIRSDAALCGSSGEPRGRPKGTPRAPRSRKR